MGFWVWVFGFRDVGGGESFPHFPAHEVTGENMKEAIEINRSLTALGDVIEVAGLCLKNT